MVKFKVSEHLHQTFVKFKHFSLIVFVLSISLFALNLNKVYGQSVVAEVKTPVVLTVDDKTLRFTATQNTVLGAVKQSGTKLAEHDITNPPSDTFLTGQLVNIRVIRALPVLISDGNQQHLATSAYTNHFDILKQLEITVFPEDKVDSELILDPVDENAIGQKVVIERAPVYTVHVDGEDKIIRSWGETIQKVLEGQVALGQRDIIDPPLETKVVRNEITVTRVNVAEIEETVSIAYETVTKNDYNLFVGQTKVTQEGAVGQKRQTVRVTYHNGEVIGRTVLNTDITSQPVTKVILKGLKPYNAGVWWDTLVAAGNKWGVNPNDMFKVMACESGGRPDAGGYYKGLFQYDPNTWLGASSAYPGGAYKGASIIDGNAQIYVTAWKVSNQGWTAWGCKP